MFDRPGERFSLLFFKTGHHNLDPSFCHLGIACAGVNYSKYLLNTVKSLESKVVSTLHHLLVVVSNHQENGRTAHCCSKIDTWTAF